MLEGPNVREFVTMALGQMLTYKPLIREDAELMISDAIRGSADARAAWSRETSLEDITDAVRHIDAPTLVISGDHDKIQPIETLRRELLPRVSGAVMQVLPNVGHLSPLEAPEEIAQRLDSFAQGASVQALSLSRIEMPSLLERNLFQHPTLPREIASVRIPDSPLAQKAVDLAFRVSPAVVWTHVLRTFVFGALVGRAQNLRYDEELFFLASVLHDLGLTTEFRGTERFEVVGADAAAAFLKDQGVNDERRAIIWDAIALHCLTQAARDRAGPYRRGHRRLGARAQQASADPRRTNDRSTSAPRFQQSVFLRAGRHDCPRAAERGHDLDVRDRQRARTGLPMPELHQPAASKSVQRVNRDLNGTVVLFLKIDCYCAIRSKYADPPL